MISGEPQLDVKEWAAPKRWWKYTTAKCKKAVLLLLSLALHNRAGLPAVNGNNGS